MFGGEKMSDSECLVGWQMRAPRGGGKEAKDVEWGQ